MNMSEVSESVKKAGKAKKTVSFAENNQLYVIEYQEPIEIEDDREYSVNNDIESMISGDETASSHVSFNALDKLSAGTAFDTTTFNAFPRRLSVESVGPAGFSMDDVIQRLLAIQNAAESTRMEMIDLEHTNISDPANDDAATEDAATEDAVSEHDASDDDEYDDPQRVVPALVSELPDRKVLPRLSLDSIIGCNILRSNSDLRRVHDDVKRDLSNSHTPEALAECVPIRLSMELIIGGASSKRNSIDTQPVDLLDAQVVATPRRASTLVAPRTGMSPSGSRKTSSDNTTPIIMSPVGNSSSCCTQDISGPSPSMPLSPTYESQSAQISGAQFKSIQSSQLSAAQFRRHERMNRHMSVATDMANGVEKYSVFKLLLNVLFLWVLLPSVLCSLSFGVIPFDFFLNSSAQDVNDDGSTRLPGDVSGKIWAVTLVPWILIMSCASLLSMEVYSSAITEIEFGVVLWESNLFLYFLTCAVAVISSMTMQVLLFSVAGPGHLWNWLPEMISGCLSVSGMLMYTFAMSCRANFPFRSATSIQAMRNFFLFICGLFILTCFGGVGYSVYAKLYTQCFTVGNKAVGILLAFLFPFLRIIITAVVQGYPGLKWGPHKGYLCAGMSAPLISTFWHCVFSCLLVGTSSSPHQLITLAVVETFIQSLAMAEILKLPRVPSRTPSEQMDRRVTSSLKYKTELKNPMQPQFSGAWTSKSSIAVDCSSVRGNDIILKGESEQVSVNVKSNSSSSRWLQSSGKDSHKSTGTGTGSIGGEAAKKNSMSFSGPTSVRAPADSTREIQMTALLGMTWVTGVLTPLSFLICSAVLSAGWNKRLFAHEILLSDGTNYLAVMAGTSDWEITANLHRVWCVDVFSPDGNTSAFAYKLLALSTFHFVLLLIGLALIGSHKISLRCNALCSSQPLDIERGTEDSESDSGDDSGSGVRVVTYMLGVLSALLEYHYRTIAFTSVFAMSIVLSIIYPWYGMNSSL